MIVKPYQDSIWNKYTQTQLLCKTENKSSIIIQDYYDISHVEFAAKLYIIQDYKSTSML